MLKVIIPWKMSFYDGINGYHPLLSSFVEACPEGVETIFPDVNFQFHSSRLNNICYSLMNDAFIFGEGAFRGRIDHKAYMTVFLNSRDPVSQMCIDSLKGNADIVFHHTAPLHSSTLPFILHYESPTTLFFPFLSMGKTRNVSLRIQPIYHMVKAQLESDNCRAIFTHLKSSHETMLRCFDSPTIAAKAHYIPLGVDAPKAMHDRIEQKIRSIPQRKPLNILFTNSAHGHRDGFNLRGGMEVLLAFQRLRQTVPDATLTILSPQLPLESLQGMDLRNVTWIKERIEEEALYELLLAADLFALPAAGLHSYSALRALKFGAVLLCSDAPGYEEYITDGKTGIIIPGRREQVYSPDPQTGWMRDDYSTVHTPQQPIADRLAAAFEWLAQFPEQRQRIAAEAYVHVGERHAIGPWVDNILRIMS